MSAYELAQLNIGIIRGPMDSPIMADFAANLARINALAERSHGFVWRLQTEEGDATAIRAFEDPNLLLNMSVWRDLESLRTYVYTSAHVDMMRRRREWFEPMRDAYLVLWWIPKSHRPTVAEAIGKARYAAREGADGAGIYLSPCVSTPGFGGDSIAAAIRRRMSSHLRPCVETRRRRVARGAASPGCRFASSSVESVRLAESCCSPSRRRPRPRSTSPSPLEGHIPR